MNTSFSSAEKIRKCPVCGGESFDHRDVLWQELICDWQLSAVEVSYINRQQGFHCVRCKNNLRSMALADAILHAHNATGTLQQFVGTDRAKSIRVLEINEAGGLNSVLSAFPQHKLVQYPEYDMTALPFESATFDLVIHSDTLEHVGEPAAALFECKRLLSSAGRCMFTVPIIIGRLTRSRAGLKNSYHGSSGMSDSSYVVHTEFGADVWALAMQAGFNNITLHCFEYPSALVIDASYNERN